MKLLILVPFRVRLDILKMDFSLDGHFPVITVLKHGKYTRLSQKTLMAPFQKLLKTSFYDLFNTVSVF